MDDDLNLDVETDAITVSTTLSDVSATSHNKGKLILDIKSELNASFDSDNVYWDGVINSTMSQPDKGLVYNPLQKSSSSSNCKSSNNSNNGIGNIDLNELGIGNFRVNLDDLLIFDMIGEGSCSSVHLAVHRKEGLKYAVKTFNVNAKYQTEQLKKEIYILATTPKHDALISFEGIFQDVEKGSVGIILEYMDRGSLLNLMARRRNSGKGAGALTEQLTAALLYQMLSGLHALHAAKKIHRDVKPGNILLNSQGVVKLTDFGVAKDDDGQGKHTRPMRTRNVSIYLSPYARRIQEHQQHHGHVQVHVSGAPARSQVLGEERHMVYGHCCLRAVQQRLSFRPVVRIAAGTARVLRVL